MATSKPRKSYLEAAKTATRKNWADYSEEEDFFEEEQEDEIMEGMVEEATKPKTKDVATETDAPGDILGLSARKKRKRKKKKRKAEVC